VGGRERRLFLCPATGRTGASLLFSKHAFETMNRQKTESPRESRRDSRRDSASKPRHPRPFQQLKSKISVPPQDKLNASFLCNQKERGALALRRRESTTPRMSCALLEVPVGFMGRRHCKHMSLTECSWRLLSRRRSLPLKLAQRWHDYCNKMVV
jgi:hypothetical protein